jgi:kynureninase
VSSRQEAERLDRGDPLASVRDEFVIPDNDLVYLDGNSLGRTPKATVARLKQVVENEWAGNLISSWDHWLDMPRAVGNRMGAIIGSLPGEVAVHDSTTLNLYQGVHIALALRPDRKVLAVAADEFPTDRYVVEGIAHDLGLTVRPLEPGIDLHDVAVVVRSVIDYRTAEICDVKAFTSLATEAGALVLWDLSHTAGPLSLMFMLSASNLLWVAPTNSSTVALVHLHGLMSQKTYTRKYGSPSKAGSRKKISSPWKCPSPPTMTFGACCWELHTYSV